MQPCHRNLLASPHSGTHHMHAGLPLFTLPAPGTLKPHCDLLLCETLATVTEGVAAATAASASGLPW